MQFVSKPLYSTEQSRPNTRIKFTFIDAYKPNFCRILSFFIIKVWSSLLKHYAHVLWLQTMMLFQQNASVGYKKLELHILSPNLPWALFGHKKVDKKLKNNLGAKRLSYFLSSTLLMCFLLRLVSKSDGKFQKLITFSSHQAFLSTIVSSK